MYDFLVGFFVTFIALLLVVVVGGWLLFRPSMDVGDWSEGEDE